MKKQNYNASAKKAWSLWLRLVCFFIVSTFSLPASQATVLINPAAEGGFENGNTFTLNGWTAANLGGATANAWYLGTSVTNLPTGYSNRVAFISNDGGLTNTYNNGNNTASHFYRDVTLPAGEATLNLSFDWSNVGEDGWDYVMVSIAPTTTAVTGSSTYPGSGPTSNGIANSTVIGAFQMQSTKQTANISIPQSALNTYGLSNCSNPTTVRLIFTWKSDGCCSNFPLLPGAVDNISLVSTPVMSAALSPFTINNTLPTSGTNFNNFTDAINWVNTAALCGFSNPVTFNVTSGQVFNEVPPALVASGTLTNRIIFQKSGVLANPEIRPTGNFNNVDYGILISGGDFITFDGININSSTSFDVEYGYLIRNASGNGAKSNIIKNCKITLNKNNFNTTIGILQTSSNAWGGGTNAVSALGVNSDNQYLDFQISNSLTGVYLIGGTTALDFNNVVGTALCSNFNQIGDPAIPNDIGNTWQSIWGISAFAQQAVKIFNNKITNLTANPFNDFDSPNVDGILIDNSGSSTYNLGTYEIHDNIISSLRIINDFSSSTFGMMVTGIRVNNTAHASSIARIYNNLVYNLNSTSTAAPSTRRIIGIWAQPGGSGAGSEMDIDHNTVHMSPTNLAITNTCFEVGTVTGPKFMIRNNNFTNFTPVQTGAAKHYTFVTPADASIGNTGSVSDFNNLYVTNAGASGNGFVGLSGAAGTPIDRQELSTGGNFWQQVAVGLDANSASANPIYFDIANGNFRVISGSLTSAVANANNGADAGWNARDLDCNLRNTLTPHDFGAYAYLGPNVDLSSASLVRPTASSCHGNNEPVIVRIQNRGVNTLNFGTNAATVSVTVSGAGSGTINTTVSTGSLAPGATLDVTVGTTNTSASGSYTFASTVSDALALDGIPSNNSRSDNVSIQALAVSIAGTSAICAGQSSSLSAIPVNHAAPVTYTWSPATGLSATTGANVLATPASTTNYIVTALDACSSTATSAAFTVTVNPLPSVSVSPTSGLICGTDDNTKSPLNYTLTASGNSNTYTWFPSGGLSATSGATVNASPYSNTSYVVTGRITATGCTSTATSVITVGPKFILNASATPSDICAGGSSQLNVTATTLQTVYAVTSIPYNPTAIATSAGTVDGDVTFAGPSGDDAVQGGINIGFPFNFFGINYNTFGISTNGNIQLGDGSGTANNPFYSSSFSPTTTPNNFGPNAYIGAPWSDYNTNYPGSPNTITYGIRGTAPNRQLVVSYNGVGSYPFGSNAQVTTQVILYETTNIIEVHVFNYLNGTTTFPNTKSIAIENATGTVGYGAPGRSTFTGEITVPEAWRFTPSVVPGPALSPAPTFAWTPNTYLSATNIANPVANAVNTTVNYTVTGSTPSGCNVAAPVQLRSGTLIANISSDDAVSCQGQNVTLTANVTSGAGPYTYIWSPGGQTTQSISIAPNTVGANNYSVVVNGACTGGGATTSANFVQTVQTTPTLNLNTGYTTVCYPSATPVTLTASGNGTSYVWSPATGLNVTTGASVQASGLSNSVNYTVVSTLGNCTATKTSKIHVPGPLYLDATANPDAVCLGTTSLLNAATATTANYTADIETVSLVGESGTVTTLNNTTPVTAGDFNNGYWQVTLPFRASFFDQGYNNIYIGTNGYVSFPQGYTVAAPTEIPSASSPNGAIFLAWKDWKLTTSGSIKYFTAGTSPNRVFVVKYVNVPPASGSGLLNGQIELYENGSVYLVLVSTDASSVKTLGIESADGSDFRSFSSLNGIPWTISTPQLFRMRADGGAFTYAWTPSASVINATAQSTETFSLSLLPANYSVVATDSSGCFKSDAVTIIEGTEMNVVVTTPDVTPCVGQNITLSVQVFGGGQPYTYQWEDNSGLLPNTTQNLTITPVVGSNTYTVTVNDACTGIPAQGTITINTLPLPTLTVTPSSIATGGGGLACGEDSVTLTATGSSISYEWSPADDLNTTTGNIVKSRPETFNVPVTYTVTGTDANQCSKSVNVPVLRAFSVSLTATATPSAVCTNGSSQLLALASLNATNYDVNSLDYSSRYTGSLSNSVDAMFDEGNETINLPFNFTFYGNSFNAVTVHANGQVLFGGNRFDADFQYSPPFFGIPDGDSPNDWFGYWSDLYSETDGAVTWGIIGSAPNRKLVIRFTAVDYYFFEPTNTFQYELTESSNTMDIFLTTNTTSSFNSRAIGIENSDGSVGLTPPNRNTDTWETTNEAWRFEFPSGGLTYQWTPSTFLTSATIKDPVAQNVTSSQPYSVLVTSSDGCKATASAPVTRSALAVPSITAADLSVCQDTLIELTANVVGGGQPYTFVWREDGVPVGTNSGNLSLPAGSAGNHTYSVTVTDVCGSPAASNSVVVTVIARPNVVVTTSNDICDFGTADLTATGATSYTWSPAATLSSSVGSTVTAGPAFTTAYNVVGVSAATGCASSVNFTQFVHLLPVVDATATPNPILLNANTQLNAVVTQNSNYGYTVVPVPFGTRDLSPVANSGDALFDEGNIDVNLPFTFNYYGNSYTGVTIHANGQILMGTGNSSADFHYSPPFSGIPTADEPNNWVGYWADQFIGSDGLITYGVVGSAPNRKLIVRFDHTDYYFSDPSNTFQVELHEGTNDILVFMEDNSTSSFLDRQIGIEDATGTQGIAAPDRNVGNWEATNEGWKFSPISFGAPAYTYSWSPPTYLNFTDIQNPFATAVGGVTTYTVNVTNTATGCDAAPSTIQVLAGVPLTIVASSIKNTICEGETVTLNATAGGGGVPYTYDWYIGNTLVFTGKNYPVSPAATTTYTVKVTDVGDNTLESAPYTITVIPNPDLIVTPPGGSICNSNTGITLTASGNSTSYEWTGNGLNTDFGSTVIANPPVTSDITVTGTRIFGGVSCQSSATVTVHKAQLGANATANQICIGEDAQLNVNGSNFLESYSVDPLAFSNMDNSALPNAGPQGDEGNVTATLGFTFRFFGNSYTAVTIHANGQILMGGFNNTADFQYTPPFNFPSTSSPNNWVGFWSDLNAYFAPSTPNITWGIVGSAPTRKFIARWSNVNYWPSSPGVTYQIELNESSDLIDVFITSNATFSFSDRLLGLENSTGTVGTAPPGRTPGLWEANNEGWRFTPPLGTFDYHWSPATFLTDPDIQNPVAQGITTNTIYTATATDPVSGCSISDTAIVKIRPNPRMNITGPASACEGQVTNLTFNFVGIPPFTYTFTDGLTTFGPLVANSNSVQVGVTPPGIAGEVFTYTPLSVSDISCDGSGGDGHTVTVVPLPDVTGVSITSDKPYNLVCSGDKITLSITGATNNTLGYQGQWKWYTGGCGTGSGGTLVASGTDKIKVSPTVNTTYYARSEGTCGNSACLSLQVLVSSTNLNGSPTVTYSPPIAYAGLTDSLVVAPVAGAYYYRWTNGGNSVVLFDGHPAPYTTTSNKVMVTFVSGATSGNGIGNYHLSFFAANGCSRSNNNNIQIRASVAAPSAINGPNVACVGQTRTYSVPAITGAKTYEWSFSLGNGTITGNGTSTVNVTFTNLPATLCVHGVSAFNSSGPDLCMNITTNILAPGAVTGDTLPCPSSSSVYTVSSVVGATSYVWSTTIPGATVVPVGIGLTATATFPAGNFTGAICVKANSGCTLSAITCLNIVNGIPAPVGTITGITTGLCNVTSVNFQVPSTGATTYTWGVPGGATITFGQGTNSILVDFSSGFGGGNITVAATNPCGNTFGSLPVTGAGAPPAITPNAATACATEFVQYNAFAPGAISYVWNVNPLEGTIGPHSANYDFIIVEWITNGGQVSASAVNSCGTSTATTITTPAGTCRVIGNAVLMNELRASVYPNPSQGHLTLEYNSPEKKDYLLKVTDLAGRLIVNQTLSGVEGLNRHELDLSKLAKGMYKLTIENADGESIVVKVVLE